MSNIRTSSKSASKNLFNSLKAAQGLTNKDVSEKLQLSEQSIVNLSDDLGNISLKRLLKMSKLFKMDPTELFERISELETNEE